MGVQKQPLKFEVKHGINLTNEDKDNARKLGMSPCRDLAISTLNLRVEVIDGERFYVNRAVRAALSQKRLNELLEGGRLVRR